MRRIAVSMNSYFRAVCQQRVSALWVVRRSTDLEEGIRIGDVVHWNSPDINYVELKPTRPRSEPETRRMLTRIGREQ